MKYKDWIKYWLNNYVKTSVKVWTFERYDLIIRLHIVEKLGEYELEQLSPIVLQEFVTELLEKGNLKTGGSLSANSVNSIISIVQSSLRTANMMGIISTCSADKIKRPRLVEKKVKCFSVFEQKKIESYVLYSKKRKLFGIVISLYTGLRIGELLALTWQDIDLYRGILSVSKTCHDSKGCLIIDSPKTSTSCREIPLPKQLLPLLKKTKKITNSEFVISSKDKPISVRSYQRTFELVLIKLSIPHKGFHALRHTFATRALECGMDIKTLSEILGHKNPTVTLNRYTHSLFEHKKNMMNRLGKML